MSFSVYILRCADNSYYTGHTDNLEDRIAKHKTGEIEGYTSTRLPVMLVFSEDFPTREEALACERQIKGWSRNKKEALMRGDWAEVSRLARQPSPFENLRVTGLRVHTIKPETSESKSVLSNVERSTIKMSARLPSTAPGDIDLA